jgi:hypothetical protein
MMCYVHLPTNVYIYNYPQSQCVTSINLSSYHIRTLQIPVTVIRYTWSLTLKTLDSNSKLVTPTSLSNPHKNCHKSWNTL